MGNIEVREVKDGSKDYVFCVYGKPVDNYSLQLAYTTNIALLRLVYAASEPAIRRNIHARLQFMMINKLDFLPSISCTFPVAFFSQQNTLSAYC